VAWAYEGSHVGSATSKSMINLVTQSGAPDYGNWVGQKEETEQRNKQDNPNDITGEVKMLLLSRWQRSGCQR